MTRFLLVAALLAPFGTQAGDWVSLSLYSYHAEGTVQAKAPCGVGSLNNCTPGVGWEHGLSRNLRTILHVYGNSHERPSFDAVLSYQPIRYGDFSFGGLVGGVTGYKDNPASPIPFAALAFSYEANRAGWNLIVIPASGGVLHLQRKWEWR